MITDAVIVAVVTGAITLVGTIITVVFSNNATQIKIQAELDKHNAIQDERIKNLTTEVQKHNAFAERIPALAARLDVVETRVANLEQNK